MRVPAAVSEAVRTFVAPVGFELHPPKPSETSSIYSWGVRVAAEVDGQSQSMWICLASQRCREDQTPMLLSGGKTSRATSHLTKRHGIATDKTTVVNERKRSRADEIEYLQNCPMYESNPKRLYVLLATWRIVRNNLAFRTGEYAESVLIKDLTVKDNFRAAINAKVVTHTIAEMYATTKREIVAYIQDNRVCNNACFTIVPDFWTCKIQGKKYLAIRLYMVNGNWEQESILLGIRAFNPVFGDRSQLLGLRSWFKLWLVQLMQDFQIETEDIFASTSDAGSDVKRMMESELELKWEWCIAHLISATTKMACGIVNDPKKSINKEMTNLVSRISKTVYQVKHVEIMGSLFESLCKLLYTHKSTTLSDFVPHRFMGLTKTIESILDKWEAVMTWYKERIETCIRTGRTPAQACPIENDKQLLVELYALLSPLTKVCAMSQLEGTNQVRVLLTLYKIRNETLNPNKMLQNCRKSNEYFQAPLHPIAAKTRMLLIEWFDINFFSRYTCPQKIRTKSFVLELQMLLHPAYKNLDQAMRKIVILCNRHLGANQTTAENTFTRIKIRILDKMRSMMKLVASTPEPEPEQPTVNGTHYSDEFMSLFEPDGNETIPTPTSASAAQTQMLDTRIEEELERWIADPVVFSESDRGESVLKFWKYQFECNAYMFLPKVARILFAIPTSSGQIERDFCNGGRLVTAQRASMAPHHVDMSSFLRLNHKFVDLTQVEQIKTGELFSRVSRSIWVDYEASELGAEDVDFEVAAAMEEISSTSFHDD